MSTSTIRLPTFAISCTFNNHHHHYVTSTCYKRASSASASASSFCTAAHLASFNFFRAISSSSTTSFHSAFTSSTTPTTNNNNNNNNNNNKHTLRRTLPLAMTNAQSQQQNRTMSSSASSESVSSTNAYQGEILCNRALNMSKINAVGFDMDYTLAMYHSASFEKLSAESAVKKLVHNLNYPTELLTLRYDHSKFIRGLVIDKEYGNIIKLDRHKYVKRAIHGDKTLTKEERSRTYDNITNSDGGFQEPRFTILDAMFSLPDAFLFSNLVSFKDQHPDKITKSYSAIYKDVRRSVDMCHRDGSIKDEVCKYPQKYIQPDNELIATLRKLRKTGRKLFLLTNSLWDYTDEIMKYLYKDEDSSEGKQWIDLFDLIITGSSKPLFMLDLTRPIYRCDPRDGSLLNTEGVQYDETATEYLSHGKCFHGGNYKHLHELLDVKHGNEILYIGDHIFSDVLRSKRTLGWRTMLVIPELEDEINTMYEHDNLNIFEEIGLLNDVRDELDEYMDRLTLSDGHEEELESMNRERNELYLKISEKLEMYHQSFHPIWGQLFKTGLQNSRFAEQVESYACLYTSKVSNLYKLNADIHWRAMNDLMPHDRLTVAPMHRVLARRAIVQGEIDDDVESDDENENKNGHGK